MTGTDQKLKMAIISGAAHALEFKRKNPNLPDEEVIQQVSRESNSILEKIDAER